MQTRYRYTPRPAPQVVPLCRLSILVLMAKLSPVIALGIVALTLAVAL